MGEERTRGCLRTMSPVHPVAAEHFLDIETKFGQIDTLGCSGNLRGVPR